MTHIPDDPERWARFAAGDLPDRSPDRGRFVQVYEASTVTPPRAPLRTWASLATTTVGLCAAVAVFRLYLYVRERVLLGRMRDGDRAADTGYGSLDELFELQWGLWVAAGVAAGICFVVWFWRVRTNAGIMAPHLQRRARGWAIGGWFCPIVNLWFPLQITRDAVYSAPERPTSRSALTLSGWWWGLWIAAYVLDFRGVVEAGTSPELESFYVGLVMFSELLYIAAAVLVIRLIGLITDLQDPSQQTVSGPYDR